MINNINQKKLLFLIYLPIFVNFVYNKLISDSIKSINLFNIFSTLLIFFVLYSFGSLIKKSLNLPFISTGIVFYFFTFFTLEYILLFFNKDIKFSNIFLYTNIAWLFYFLFVKSEFKNTFKITILLIGSQVFNFLYFEKITKEINIIGYVKDVLYKHVQNIFEYNYFFSMNNASMEGYPQLTAYFQAIIHKIAIYSDAFQYFKPASNVIFLLVLLLFFELNLKLDSKILIFLLYTILIFNSEWFKFLFIDSLMTEGVVGYVFATLLLSILKNNFNVYKGNAYSFFLFGLLFIAKQFISTISILIILSMVFIKLKRKFIIFGIFGIILKEVSFLTYFKELTKNYHLKEVDILDTVFDILLLRNLKLDNIQVIIKNLFLDKPFSFITLIFFIFLFIYIFYFKLEDIELNFIAFAILLNYLFVILLYISIWKNMELESPIRFFLNMYPLTLYFQIKVIDKLIYKY